MKISIITICYNPGTVLRSAIESVLAQSYQNVEYLIVDGGSTDGTVEWLAELVESQPTVKMVSEPDKGLYDALNKGVRLATGDVIGFVHADDFFAHEDVLKHVAEKMRDGGGEMADALYGDLQYVRESGRRGVGEPAADASGGYSQFNHDFAIVRHWRSGEYDKGKLKWGWMPPHPTLYLKREVYERSRLENGEYFDTSFKCSADYDFMMRVLSALEIRPVYLPEVMVKMRVGGVSNRSLKHILQKSKEDWVVIQRNGIGHLHTLVWKNLSKVGQFFGGKD